MSVDLSCEDYKTKMGHMSKMFQMYSTKEFVNGCDLWLAGICRYLNDAYPPLAGKVCFIEEGFIRRVGGGGGVLFAP